MTWLDVNVHGPGGGAWFEVRLKGAVRKRPAGTTTAPPPRQAATAAWKLAVFSAAPSPTAPKSVMRHRAGAASTARTQVCFQELQVHCVPQSASEVQAPSQGGALRPRTARSTAPSIPGALRPLPTTHRITCRSPDRTGLPRSTKLEEARWPKKLAYNEGDRRILALRASKTELVFDQPTP